jgi:hypothetical protein
MKATGTAILALVVGFSAGHAQAAGDYLSWQGQWKLNMEKTKYPPEIPVTGNDLTVSKDDGNVLQYSGAVTVGGKTVTASYDGAYDGKPHDAGGGQTLTYHHIDKSTFASERKAADGTVAERSTCKLTTNGKTFTCHIELPRAGKKALVFDEHFDRVS